MKKFLSAILVLCMFFCGMTVSVGAAATYYQYTVRYNTDCDMSVMGKNLVSVNEVIEYTLSSKIPQKEGYTFLGWSTEPRDYVNDPLYMPDEKIEISSSTVFHAVWKSKSEVVLEYGDGIFPAHKSEIGAVKLSERVPLKEGYAFCGWKTEDTEDATVYLPGDVITIESDTVLIPLWKKGEPSELTLTVSDTTSGTLFECGGFDDYDSVEILAEYLNNDEKITIPCGSDTVLADDLKFGQYRAYVSAEKYGIKYKSDEVNFAVTENNPDPSNPLAVFMDGKQLAFDMPPVILGGHTYVTLRYFCEYIGADVYWDEPNATAVITYNGMRVKIKENSNVFVLNGATYELPAKTVIMLSRMFIPLRAVAEFMNCEIVWDESQKVYIFTGSANIFDNNVFYIKEGGGKYLSLDDAGLCLTAEKNFGSMWVFGSVDEEKGIYEIYNFCDMETPLEVKLSEVGEGQLVRFSEKNGYDGHLWRICENSDGSYSISPEGDGGYFLDAANMSITSENIKLYLQCAYR